MKSNRLSGSHSLKFRTAGSGGSFPTRLDIKDCPLARGNQIWLSGKQIFMPACPTDNQIFHIFVHIYYIGQVKLSQATSFSILLARQTSGSKS
jgi:hypothetical protein